MSAPVAIVTGAGRGIGAAIVAALAATGWRVVAVDRGADDPRLPYPLASVAELEGVVAAANEAADAEVARAVLADAADLAVFTAVVAAAEEWGGVEAVVANAGAIAGGAPAWEVPLDRERAVLEACLDSTLVAARAGIPALLRRPAPRRGRFVAIASAAAARGLPGLAAYSAAKAGVAGLVRGLAADLRGSGVTANAVAPGSTRTPMLEESARLYDLDGPERFAEQALVGRLLEPAEVAALVEWLLGPGGAALTGATVPIDGGLTA